MSRFLMVGDVHLSDQPPSTRHDGYATEILEKLVEVGEIAEKHSCRAIVFVGDVFHSKIPRNTSHQLVRSLMDIWREYPCPILVVPGNHDYQARNVSTLHRHPLGVVSSMPEVHLIGTPHSRQLTVGDTVFYGVREEEDIDAFYPGHLEPYFEKYPEKHLVVVAHSAIFPPGYGPPHWEHFDAGDIAKMWFDRENPIPEAFIYYGHIHEPHGHYVARTGREELDFVNYGAISRGSLHEKDHDRIPEVGLIQTIASGGATVEPIQLLSARPAQDVFRYEEVHDAEVERVTAADFAEELEEVSLGVFSIEGLIDRLRRGMAGEDVPPEVVETCVELILEASG